MHRRLAVMGILLRLPAIGPQKGREGKSGDVKKLRKATQGEFRRLFVTKPFCNVDSDMPQETSGVNYGETGMSLSETVIVHKGQQIVIPADRKRRRRNR